MKRWVMLCLLLGVTTSLAAGDRFPLRIDIALYGRIDTGGDRGLAEGDGGTAMNRDGSPIGVFHVLSVSETQGVIRIRLTGGASDADLAALCCGSRTVPFIGETDGVHFIASADRATGAVVGKKGQIFIGPTLAGTSRVIGVREGSVFIRLEQGAPGIDPREADSGRFQSYFEQIVDGTGFVNLTFQNLIMLCVGILFIYLGIAKDYEPLLLVPIGFGILIGNIPLPLQIFNSISLYMIDPATSQYVFNTSGNSVMGILYFGVRSGLFPPLIFLGIGAMTDFTALLSNPRSVLLGAAAQVGIFITFIGALLLKFSPAQSASIGIIGGADGPTAIFLSSRLAPTLIGPIAIAAYSYMAMVPIIQPPIMKLLTSRRERLIRMKPGRRVKRIEKILFPVVGFIITTMVAPGAIPLLGMLFFGNLLKESGVTSRLAKTASNALVDICTILLGVAVGASTTAQVFLNTRSMMIFVLGVLSFAVATAGGVLFAKFLNLFAKVKINPLIGAAGVSAVPDSARVVHNVGKREDPENYLLQHAMGPNVAGVIGSAIAAGVFIGIF